MHLESLPNELVVHVFQACNSVPDVLNLASTCHRFQRVLALRRLPLLACAAESQFGPLQDAIQVATHNASQAAHVARFVPFSLALLRQVVEIGGAAQKWIDCYPLKKWKTDSASRRLLTPLERYKVRRAIYRLWLYSKAFHNPQHVRTSRGLRHNVLERAELLHNWTHDELAEIEDVRSMVREVLTSQVCPSNGTIQRRFRKRYPESNERLLFNCNIHLNYQVPNQGALPMKMMTPAQVAQAAGMKFAVNAWHEPGGEGWGDDVLHYYVVEDMLKLDPGQIIWLRDNAPLKGMVEGYVKGLGEWFENNGETFGQTLEWVLHERGQDLEEMKDAIVAFECGIVVD